MSDLNALDAYVITPGEAAVPPAPPAPGVKQRLRIHVPRVRSTLYMGEKCASPDNDLFAGEKNYDGVGIVTDGHMFLDAERTMTLQSTSSAALQSSKNLALGGKSGLYAGSSGGVTIAGGGGVTILGGFPKSWPANYKVDGTEPKEPQWVAPVNSGAAAVTMVASGIDAALAAYGMASGASDVWLGLKKKKFLSAVNFAWAAGAFGGFASAVGATAGVASLAGWENETVSDLSSALAGTLIYGNMGMILATPVTLGMYSLAGTTIATPAALGLTGGFVEIVSLKDTKINAAKGSMEISAKGELHIKSEKSLKLGSKSKPVSLMGSHVAIGAPSGSGGQASATTVALDAEFLVSALAKRVALEGSMHFSALGDKTSGLTSNGITYVTAKDNVAIGCPTGEVNVAGKKHVELQCEGSRLTIKKDKVMIGLGPGKPGPPPIPPRLEPDEPMPNDESQVVSWLLASMARWSRNDKKAEKAAKDYEKWAKKVKNLKETKSGIIIKKGKVEISVDGTKHTFDKGKLKGPSFVEQK